MRSLFLWLMCFSVIQAAELRIVSYNIHLGRGMDGKVDLKRIADIIRKENPDLVALQEVDVNVERSGNVDTSRKLAELLGMHHSYGKAINLDGGAYGNAVLSKFPIVRSKVHKLPGQGEARVVLQVDVKVRGKWLTFCSTHFDHRQAEVRQLQAKAMNKVLDSIQHPLIVAGDLNARPKSKTMLLFKKSWHVIPKTGSSLTSPADKPRHEIDYIMTRHIASETARCRVIDEKVASDHRPVSGMVRIP